MNASPNRLLLVDAASYLYRAFHALPEFRSPAGEPTGAILGVINMLRKLRQDFPSDYVACVFDAKGRTFRDDVYPEYKATRQAMPEDLARLLECLSKPFAAFAKVPPDQYAVSCKINTKKGSERIIRAAFEFLESQVAAGRIRFYGMATWNGFRVPPDAPEYLSLAEIAGLAREVASEEHHFRFVQLPYNLGMPEALSVSNQKVDGEEMPMVEAARRLGIALVPEGRRLFPSLTVEENLRVGAHLRKDGSAV